jgi:hypothetical protein
MSSQAAAAAASEEPVQQQVRKEKLEELSLQAAAAMGILQAQWEPPVQEPRESMSPVSAEESLRLGKKQLDSEARKKKKKTETFVGDPHCRQESRRR